MDGHRLRQLFVLANDFKEGDLLVGGTRDDVVRTDARRALLDLTIGAIRRTPLVGDGVTESLDRARRRTLDGDIDGWTIRRLKERLLAVDAPRWVDYYRDALTSEAIAAVVKVMTSAELSTVALALFNPLESGNHLVQTSSGSRSPAIGAPSHFGSRIQPNSPGDDEEEILFSTLEGLSYGCGDVILGLNPASDDLETIVRLEQLLERIVTRLNLPTRYCVLSDIVKQDAARQRTRVDVGFQSLAGTSRALTGMVGLDVPGLADLARGFGGLYFETGQGSAVTNGADEGVDMVTLESRAYGVARAVGQAATHQAGMPRRQPWMIVNDVAGFIGPEVFASAEQLERACLEDTVMAKLHGLTMGLDVCATFHMGITPDALRALTARIVTRAAPAYLMAVAGNADPMLGYMTTAFRDHPALRLETGRVMAGAMRSRLSELGVPASDDAPPASATTVRLFAAYENAGGHVSSSTALEKEGLRRLHQMNERGFDLGVYDAARSDDRLDRIYTHARRALYGRLASAVIRDATTGAVCVRSAARDRDHYLAHPPAGEQLGEGDQRIVASLTSSAHAGIQFVISDGLNADAVNEQLRELLPRVRRLVSPLDHVSAHDIVVENGRVRIGYEIATLLQPRILVHLIGERPGTGLNTLSAYVTYGKDGAGQWRWSRALDHSQTSAVCGIHPRGTPAAAAAEEIAATVQLALQLKVSGVALRGQR